MLNTKLMLTQLSTKLELKMKLILSIDVEANNGPLGNIYHVLCNLERNIKNMH